MEEVKDEHKLIKDLLNGDALFFDEIFDRFRNLKIDGFVAWRFLCV